MAELIGKTAVVTVTKPTQMEWSNNHDILFLREVLVSNIYETRKGSSERGKIWDDVAERLNKLSTPKFQVIKRSLRDRLNLLISKYKAKNREEERASGISPDLQEIDVLLDEICAKEEESVINNTDNESKKKKAEQDKATAEEMRTKAMESMGETKKRKEKNGEECSSTKRTRRGTNDAMDYLKEKVRSNILLKEKKFDLRQKEESKRDAMLGQQAKIQQDMLGLLQQQQQDQQKQQQLYQQQHMQTMQTMLQQQQLQTQAMMSLLEKFASK